MKTAKKLAFIPRMLTASQRSLPDFIVIGAQKGGSSALYKFICAHPKVERAFVKEPHYFSGQYTEKSLKWYKAQFPIKKEGILVGEASPSYCTHPLAPKRIKETVPNTKLILIVRNPVERAISNYFHSVNYGVEDLAIEDAFNRPMADFESEYAKMENSEGYHSKLYHRHAYIHKGHYAFHLKKWFEHFNKKQLLIVENAHLLETPERVYQEVLEFLGLETFTPNAFQKHNVGKTKQVSPELLNTLQAHFKEPNRAFFELIGKEYNW